MFDRPRRAVSPRWRPFLGKGLAIVVCVLAISTLVFGLGGFVVQFDAVANRATAPPADPSESEPANQDWSVPLYKTVQLFILNSGSEDDSNHPSNWLLILARVSASALFIVVSSAVIKRFLDEFRQLPGHLRRRDHVVVCGLGQIGLQLLDDLSRIRPGREIVVVENNPDNSWLDYARSLGATIVLGDSTRENTLAEARATRAREVFVVNGDDGVNLEVAAELGMMLARHKPRAKPLRLHVHVVDTNFAAALSPYCGILHDAPNMTPNMSLQIFNVTRSAASVLASTQLWKFAPRQPREVAHFVILGFGPMGQTLAVQLAQLAHFPNCKRSRFTIADHSIKQTAAAFLSQFSRFTSWTDDRFGVDSFSEEADDWNSNAGPLPAGIGVPDPRAIQYACNAEFVDFPYGGNDERFAARIAKRLTAPGVKPVVFICGQQDRENFETAVHLRDQLSVLGLANVPLFVWLPRHPALAATLSRASAGGFFPFGECRTAASYREITEPLRDSLGRRIHEDYQRQELARDPKAKTAPWGNLADDLRESNRVAADHLLIKLAVLGLRLRRSDQPSIEHADLEKRISLHDAKLLAEMEHYRWVAERLLAGWRFAPQPGTKEEIQQNKKRKWNHNLVAWQNLGSEKRKDFEQVKSVLHDCQEDGYCVEDLPAEEA